MSTPAKHTPWRVERIEYSKGMDVSFEIVGGVNHVIAQTIMREKGDGWRDEIIKADEAHCHLMAAAPTMFDALAELKAAIEDGGLCNGGTPGFDRGRLDRAMTAADAALAVATPVLEREG